MPSHNVEEIHKALFDLINEKGLNLTDADMAPYVHDTVIHNGQAASRSELAHNTTLAFKAGPAMHFRFDVISVDNDAGKDADGNPRQALKGQLHLRALEDGKEVDGSGFSEEFTYWFVDGKIKESKSDANKDEVKRKMAQAGSA